MNRRIAVVAALAAWAGLAQAEETVRPKLASGILMKQGGKVVFAPCRERTYALVDDLSANGAVTAALNGIGLEAGKKLYVELFAVMEGAALKASGLNFARAEGRCQQPGGKDEAWRATGPGWTLAAGGEQLRLKRPGRPDVTVPYETFKGEGNTSSYEVSRAGNKLALRFVRAMCHDPEGDAVLGWTATLTANGETLKGCAWQR